VPANAIPRRLKILLSYGSMEYAEKKVRASASAKQGAAAYATNTFS